MDFLIPANRDGFGDERDPAAPHAKGKRVIVVGGGDTAMDCVRTAVRQGATSVTCLYRRDRANMPGSAREVASAEEEGVRFEWLAAPKAILTRDDQVAAVRAARMRLGPPDASGRQAPEETPDGDFELGADLVFTALGFDPEDPPKLFEAPELSVTRRGTLAVEPFGAAHGLEIGSGLTRLDGVFAAGDVVRGASLVVWALRDGLSAADQIDAWIAARRGAQERVAAQ
jgi:glutamate synthase (NADPH/NADH) small chain